MSIEARINSMPLAKVFAAWAALTGTQPAGTKAEGARVLARAVNAGTITLQWIEQGGVSPILKQAPAKQAPQAPQAPATASGPALAAVQAVAERAEQNTVALATDISRLTSAVSTLEQSSILAAKTVSALGQGLATVGNDITSLRAEVKAARSTRVDPAEVRSEVASAVAATLTPLLPAMTPVVAQQVVAATAAPVARVPASKVFGVDARDARGNELQFDLWDHPEAPPVDFCFIWTEGILRTLYLMQETGRNAWLGGPAGTGKSQTMEQFAARTGRLFRRFVFDKYSTREDYLGAMGLDSGSTQFQPGAILDVYTTPGAIGLLDEVGIANPAALSSLNGFLEPGARMAYANKVWPRAHGNLFAAADNSLTQGDQSGRFAGVQQMNTAFSERFAFVVPFAYLDPAVEAQALVKHTGCTQRLAEHVVAVLTLCRQKVDSGDIIDPPSIRQAIAFIEACRVLPVDEAWRLAIMARQPAESQVGLGAVYSAAVSTSLIESEI